MRHENHAEIEPTPTKKLRQEIVIKMSDGEIICGRIFTGFNQNILDILHDERQFIPIELENHSVVLIAKSAIMMADCFQKNSENASKFQNETKNSTLYRSENTKETPSNNTHPPLMNNNNMQYIADKPLKNEFEYVTPGHQAVNNHTKNYDEIYSRYTHIVKTLNNPIFKEKRKKDKQFDDDIHSIIDALKMTASLLEETKKM